MIELAPVSGRVLTPYAGYAWLYILGDGVPSAGKRVMIGDGQGPPVFPSAIKNMLAKTKP